MRPAGLDPSLKREILIEQIGNRAQVAAFMIPFGVTAAAVFAWYFGGLGNSDNNILTYAFLFVLISYLIYGAIVFFWTKKNIKNFNPDHLDLVVPIFYISTTTLGVAWSLLIFLASHFASANSIGVIYAMEIALISMTIVSPPFKFSMCIWIPLVVCGYATIYTIGFDYRLALFIFLTLYAAVTFLSCLSTDRTAFQKSLSMIENRKQAETISILLNEFAEENSNCLWAIDAEMGLRNVSRGLRGMLDQLDPSGKAETLTLPELIRQFVTNASNTISGEELIAKITAGEAFREFLISVRAGRAIRFWSITGRPITDAFGAFAGYQGYLSDRTDAVLTRRELEFLANFDSVTKLLNRHQFERALRDQTTPTNATSFALMLIDLDHFKQVNDTLGHPAGDRVLEIVARRLQRCVREGDLIARIGGDEFAILLHSQKGQRTAEVGRRIINAIEREYTVDTKKIVIGASVGVAIWPDHGADDADLYRNADTALYCAKAAGRNRVWIFGADPETNEFLAERATSSRAASGTGRTRAG